MLDWAAMPETLTEPHEETGARSHSVSDLWPSQEGPGSGPPSGIFRSVSFVFMKTGSSDTTCSQYPTVYMFSFYII